MKRYVAFTIEEVAMMVEMISTLRSEEWNYGGGREVIERAKAALAISDAGFDIGVKVTKR